MEHLTEFCIANKTSFSVLQYSNIKLQQFLTVLLIIASLVSCKKNTTPGNNPQTILNVAYGNDPLQNMDVFLPASRSTSTTKVIIMIHGGGWNSGDKTEILYTRFIDTLKIRLPDYAIFNINYRLSNTTANLFPTQENDVKAALEFIFSKSSEYLISNKYVLIGASAGAHLAMLQGYKYTVPVKPKAIVSFFGPGDLIDMYNNPANGIQYISLVLAQTVGKTPVQDPLLYYNSSPINFINAASPPTILLHGGADPLVSSSQSENIKNKLAAAGVPHQYVFYPGKGHGDWDNASFSNAFINIEAFLTAQVQ
jgi:acetyl esterase/lipase